VREFAVFEVLLFLFLAIDDRFMAHEQLRRRHETMLMSSLGVLQLAAVWRRRDLILWRPGTWLALLFAAVWFAVMLVFDILLPSVMFLRLSIENLAKTGSALMLAIFAWVILNEQLADIAAP
jgi:hypothetical protein